MNYVKKKAFIVLEEHINLTGKQEIMLNKKTSVTNSYNRTSQTNPSFFSIHRLYPPIDKAKQEFDHFAAMMIREENL